MGAEPKRTYLVVIDDSAEARVALRFAARRAAKTGGRIEVLRLRPEGGKKMSAGDFARERGLAVAP